MQYPDTTTVYYVSQTALPLDAYAFYGLGRSLVIVVQSTQHRNCDQLVRLVRWRHRKHRQNRDLLLDPLLRSGMIEVLCIRHEKPAELLLMKNEKVIETFSPYASQIAFADGVRAARVRYGVRRTLMPLVVATRAKFGPNFRSLSRIKYFGVCPYGVASRSCCATH
jgi:hypothetical protein